jgi:tryptophan synthase beta chain
LNDYDLPDARGHFGPYGGVFVAETLIAALDELKEAYAAAQRDPQFVAEFNDELKHYVGRPSPVYHARRWSEALGGAQIYLKREDLNHTGAHKINNCIGQALLARRMQQAARHRRNGSRSAWRGDGHRGRALWHGVRGLHGFGRHPAAGGQCVSHETAGPPWWYRSKAVRRTLKDALNEAMRDWVTNVSDTFYIIGTVAGPHPYPMMVRDFQSIIGRESIVQMQEQCGRQPDAVIACVGGGSNAMGIFYPYIPVAGVRLIGVEAAGEGIATGQHAASLTAGRPGVLHGNRTYLLQDENGQITETHSISAGLDYPGVGPEHAWLKDSGRAEYVSISDAEALQAFHDLCRLEGIIPALESSHALAYASRLAPTLAREQHPAGQPLRSW